MQRRRDRRARLRRPPRRHVLPDGGGAGRRASSPPASRSSSPSSWASGCRPGTDALRRPRATDYVTPALEILDARVELSDPETGHRATSSTPSPTTPPTPGSCWAGGPCGPLDVDLRWVVRAAAAQRLHRGVGRRRRGAEPPGQRRGLAGQPARAARRPAARGRGHPRRLVHDARSPPPPATPSWRTTVRWARSRAPSSEPPRPFMPSGPLFRSCVRPVVIEGWREHPHGGAAAETRVFCRSSP